MVEAQPIDTAPHNDGWILAYVPKRAEQHYVAWLALTWGDSGWMDDDGNACDPTLWSPLPDPQPNRTAWMPPEGVIHVEEITGEGWKLNGKPTSVPYRWSVYILRLDGTYDEYREICHYVTYPEAEARAAKWQQQFGLPIEASFLDPKVVPFAPRGLIQ